MSHLDIIFPAPLFAQLSVLGQSATFLNGSQTDWELPHTARRSGSCFQLRLQGDHQAHQSHRSAQASGQFNFLKPQCPFVSKGRRCGEESSAAETWTVKHLNTASLKVSFFSFLLNVNSHVSLSPSITEHPPMYKIGITLSSHPLQTQQITHLCTYIHKLKGQSMVVGTYLLKDESKTDSHLECEVTTAQNSQQNVLAYN